MQKPEANQLWDVDEANSHTAAAQRLAWNPTRYPSAAEPSLSLLFVTGLRGWSRPSEGRQQDRVGKARISCYKMQGV